MKVGFGIRIPSFPLNSLSAFEFMNQLINYLSELEDYFDSAWISDHFIPWTDAVSINTPTLECWTTISYLSARFKKLLFGSIVLCNSYRNPALVAKMTATLSLLSGGRIVLGIGAGWMEKEYFSYGYAFPKASERISQLEEAVIIIKEMLSKGEVTFEGKHYKVYEAKCYPRPIKHVPIMIGGGGEKLLLKVVAKHADWWNLANATLSEFERKIGVLEKHCREVRRSPDKILKSLATIVSIAESRSEADEIAERNVLVRKFGRKAFLIGSPNEVSRLIENYVELGVKHFILRFADFPDTRGAKLFYKEVASSF